MCMVVYLWACVPRKTRACVIAKPGPEQDPENYQGERGHLRPPTTQKIRTIEGSTYSFGPEGMGCFLSHLEKDKKEHLHKPTMRVCCSRRAGALITN